METIHSSYDFQRAARKAASIGCRLEYTECGYKVYTAENLWCSACIAQHFDTLRKAEFFIIDRILEALTKFNKIVRGYWFRVESPFGNHFGTALVMERIVSYTASDCRDKYYAETLDDMYELFRMEIIATVNAF